MVSTGKIAAKGWAGDTMNVIALSSTISNTTTGIKNTTPPITVVLTNPMFGPTRHALGCVGDTERYI
jgi:hypothetical protein